MRRPLEAAKRCAGPCGRVLKLSDFQVDNGSRDGRQSWCPACKAANGRYHKWEQAYGVWESLAERTLGEVQQFRCPICGLSLAFEDDIVLDHNRETGEARGFLHRVCNTRPPKDGDWAARWVTYDGDPPVRRANGGVPVYEPRRVGGQLPLG